MNDDHDLDQAPESPVMEDRVELALRERITVLEEWRAAAAHAIQLLGLAAVAAAAAVSLLYLLVRRRVP